MNLKEIRLQKGITVKEIAQYISVGTNTYTRYEAGERVPSIDVLIKIADYFNVSLDELVGRGFTDDSAKYDVSLLSASRNADDRAKKDALQLLLAHPAKAE